MKTVFKIYANDIKKIFTNVVIFIVVIGISLIPALYAWFNIISNHDPYGATDQIAIAVVNLDKGVSKSVLSINCGEQIVENLKQNTQMGWTFVDTVEAAKEGIERGDYYAVVVISENFSADIIGFLDGKIVNPQITYYVNEKKNAIAPKITDKGIQAIEKEVDSTFVQTVINALASVLNVTTDDVDVKQTELCNKIIDALNEVKTSVSDFSSVTTTLHAALNGLQNTLKTVSGDVPDLQNKLNNAGDFTQNIKGSVTAFEGMGEELSNTVSNILTAVDSLNVNINAVLDEICASVEQDTAVAAQKLLTATNLNERVITVNNKLIDTLQTLNNKLHIKNDTLIQKLKNANTKQEERIALIEEISSKLQSSGEIPAELKGKLDRLNAEIDTLISEIKNTYNNTFKSTLQSAVSDTTTLLDTVSDTLDDLCGELPEISTALNETVDTVAELNTAVDSIGKLTENLQNRLNDMIEKVEEIQSDTALPDLVTKITGDPEALSSFIASPVEVSTQYIYPVKDYGSGMAPFYSSLAIWVGVIVLAAVVRIDINEKDCRRIGRTPNSVQHFFGKYLTFFTLSVFQGLIIALGDLVYIGIQCTNPLYFIVACVAASLSMSILVYALTFTFSLIGKALAVVLLVIQVAGSGGTFPIEVLPTFFRNLYPFMPFRYSVNAMREAVAGAYGSDFWLNILGLLAFVPVALFIGLVLDKIFKKVIAFFDKQVEESNLMI